MISSRSTYLRTLLLGCALASGCGNCGGRQGANEGKLTTDDGDGVGSGIDFGNVLVNESSAPQKVTISNTGAAPLGITSATLTGANASDFKLTSPFPASIAPGNKATAIAVFTPGGAGARQATLAVATDGESGTVDLAFTGFGVDIEICASPAALAFGDVQIQGTPIAMSVTLSNCGQSPASVAVGALSGAQPGDFSVASVPTTTLQPGAQVLVSVSYAPQAVGGSAASLAYQACDTNNDCATNQIALTGNGVDGALTFAPSPMSFTGVPSGQTANQTVTATNSGTESINLTGLNTLSGVQTVFAIQGGPSLPATLAPGQSATFTIDYTPLAAGGDSDDLIGTFTVADPGVPAREVTDPLSGNGASSPCSLSVSPASLNFGNVPPMTATTYSVTLTNLSTTASCNVSSVALDPSSDPSYSLPSTQALSFTIAPSGTAPLAITIDPANDNAPLLKTGTLDFDTDGTPANGSVPLTAYVNSACAQAATQVIYTVDENGKFSGFDPTTLTFTAIGTLSCPTSGFGDTPFSMAVDQNAVAWVLYASGSLFQVNTSNAACTSTSFGVDQHGLLNFGMSFMTDPTLGTDTLYVAGGTTMSASATKLATIAFPSLSLTTVGSVALGWPELTGTGDGQLWGFFPASLSTTGSSVLAQLDPATGDELMSYPLPQLDSASDSNFALKFYGGAFWLFLGKSVYEIQRSNGAFSTPLANSGHSVVGAGVSTCVPVQ